MTLVEKLAKLFYERDEQAGLIRAGWDEEAEPFKNDYRVEAQEEISNLGLSALFRVAELVDEALANVGQADAEVGEPLDAAKAWLAMVGMTQPAPNGKVPVMLAHDEIRSLLQACAYINAYEGKKPDPPTAGMRAQKALEDARG